MADAAYNRYFLGLAEGDEDWEVGDYRALLLTTAGFDATDATLANVVAGAAVEASDGSYARVALTSEAAALSSGTAQLDADDIDFGSLDNETPVAMIIYRHVDGTDANDLPVSYHDSGFGAAANGAGYTVALPNQLIHIS